MQGEGGMSKNGELRATAYEKLFEHGVISRTCKIKLEPCHCIVFNHKPHTHFIISCTNSSQKFFLKVRKKNDNTIFCNQFLQELRDTKGKCPYPVIVVPEFEIEGVRYYITTFFEGETLDNLLDTLSLHTLDDIASRLQERLKELSTIQAVRYSERGEFVSDGCSAILKKKLREKLHHPLFSEYCPQGLEQAVGRCCELLDNCQFSAPTLLHMDIKPANIIYNPNTASISLIDFEFARFGDSDYGWTQILLSGCNHFKNAYKKHLVPRLVRGHLTLEDALDTPKFQCYLLYQTMCNFIYYYERNSTWPEEMQAIFHQTIRRL